MTPEQSQAFFEALLKEDQQLAVPRYLARHLARVLLAELTGLDALEQNTRALAQNIVATAPKFGMNIKIISTFRTEAEQNRLYAQGRTLPGPVVTNAQAGQSYHNYGLAFDIGNADGSPINGEDGALAHIGTYAESIGLVWGESFGDFGHFEYHPNFSWEQIIGFFQTDI